MSRCRLALDHLAVVLDLPQTVRVVGANVSGQFIDLELEGATLDPPPPGTSARIEFDSQPPPDELVAEYEVRLGHRLFSRFRLPEGPPEAPIGTVTPEQEASIAALYPPGPLPREVTLATPEMVEAINAMVDAPTEETLPPSGEGSRGKTKSKKEG